MRLLFIRHGDPDYEHDTLTEKGKVEAGLLADIIDTFGIDDVYQSPLGRARDTARYSLDVLGKEAVTFDWLREFPAEFDPNRSENVRRAYANELKIDPETGEYQKRIVWDILPAYFAEHPELFDVNAWRDSELVKASDMLPNFLRTTDTGERGLYTEPGREMIRLLRCFAILVSLQFFYQGSGMYHPL